MNRVFLTGAIEGVDVRATAKGEVANIRLKTSEAFNGKVFDTWHTISTFDAEQIAKLKPLSKGDMVTLTGKIRTRSYEAKDGSKRYVTEIVVSKVDDVIVHGASATEPAVSGPARQVDYEEELDDAVPF